VRTRNTHPHTHTRLPRYARGKAGVVERVHGVHVFPDSNARFAGEDPQWLYSVRFTAQELWGSDERASVTIDAFEPYLSPA
jgi:nitrile hydratase